MREESIFLRALGFEVGPQRDAFLKKECAGDAALQKSIEKLLEAHQNQDSFFERTRTSPTVDENEPVASVGSQIGDFEIISELGRGGMGIVYRATQKSLNRPVALKILPNRFGLNQRAIVRFRREAEAAARLHHTNIVPIYSTGESNGVYFYAMEVIDGPSLDRVLRAIRGNEHLQLGEELPSWVYEAIGIAIGGESLVVSSESGSSNSHSITREIYFDKVAKMFAGVAHALHHAHEQGVIHRDIKPANLLLSSDGRLSINDFGLARVFDQASLTLSGEFVGTPRYMSPEQITAGRAPLDHRTDIYSLGAALYELLTFQPPFPGSSRDEVVAQILHKDPPRPQRVNPRVPRDLETICMKALERDPERRYASADDLAADLERFLNRYTILARRSGIIAHSWKWVRRNRMLSASITVVAVAILVSAILIVERRKIQSEVRDQEYARSVVLPEIRILIAAGDYAAAFDKLKTITKVIPGERELLAAWRDVAVTMSVYSEPPGAQVVLRKPGRVDEIGRVFGVTPIDNIQLPRGCFCWHFSKSGYDSSDLIRNAENDSVIECELVRTGTAPEGMVRVAGGKPPVSEQFFIDREEVSNSQFQRFVDSGGYTNPAYWEALIQDHGEKGVQTVVSTFVDQTNQPGPANWRNGTHPVGEGEMPVRGISWYEAVAYAKFLGKSLPSIHHWRQAAGQFRRAFATVPFSNIGGRRSGPVDYAAGMSKFGAHHMAGNVREWCWNASETTRRYQLGGSWSDPSYLYSNSETDEATSRSEQTGFRCMWHEPNTEAEAKTLAAVPQVSFRVPEDRPVSDNVFESWRSVWEYSKDDLNQRLVDEKEDQDWVERILEYGQPRSEGRMRAHLFIPKGFEAPYQTIVFFPGGSANKYEREFGVKKSSVNWIRLNFLLKSGRAVCCPIYSGTYERMDEMVRRGADPHGHVDWSNRVLREVSRTIDLLEKQPDIDHDRIAYVGTSWGGSIGPRILAVEPRLKAGVLALGGLYHDDGLPQTNDVNFLSRVKVPVLMLNGRHDLSNTKEEVEYVLENLGTGKTNKQLKFFESGHAVPVEQLLEWTDTWLDKYLGPNNPSRE